MYLSWHGHSCFKIVSKTDHNEEVTLVTDPFNDLIGLKTPRLEAQLVTLNNTESEELDPGSVRSDFFLIDSPGEYEVKQLYIQGIRAFRDNKKGQERGVTTIFKIVAEDISVVHLGYLSGTLSEDQLSQVGKCDILLVPVGNKEFLSTKDAMEVISQVEPMIIIPMIYKIPELTIECDSLDAFSKEMGLKNQEVIPKLRLAKKDLLSAETKVVVLEKT
jgi:L-ascorbate metabolism protein UlaG (beta-lactamase superfamily)